MKKLGKLHFAAGFVLGGLIFGGISAIAANGVLATLSVNKIYVDGAAVNITAYAIEGHNYVQLRDIAEAVDFGVDYDGATNSVIVDSTASYAKPTAVAPLQPVVTPVVTPAPTTIGYPEKSNLWTVNPWTRQALTATATKTRDSFIASLSGLSDLDKLKMINELVCKQMTYDLEYYGTYGTDEDFWGIGIRGVCTNYARSTTYLCNLAELPCVNIEGNVSFSKTQSNPDHEWNEVYIDGKWEFYDPTNSDTKIDFCFGEKWREKEKATDTSPNLTLKSKEKKVPGSTT
jgi:hypothetical protein